MLCGTENRRYAEPRHDQVAIELAVDMPGQVPRGRRLRMENEMDEQWLASHLGRDHSTPVYKLSQWQVRHNPTFTVTEGEPWRNRS